MPQILSVAEKRRNIIHNFNSDARIFRELKNQIDRHTYKMEFLTSYNKRVVFKSDILIKNKTSVKKRIRKSDKNTKPIKSFYETRGKKIWNVLIYIIQIAATDFETLYSSRVTRIATLNKFI